MDRKYDKSKTAKILTALFALCSLCYLFLLFWTNQRVKAVDVSQAEDASDYMEYKIERVRHIYGYVDIRGYAYEPGVSLDIADTVVLAYDPVSGIYYSLPTENVKKAKITKKADDGYDYDYAQFQSVVLEGKIPSGCKVCIWYRGNGTDRLIQTEEVITL